MKVSPPGSDEETEVATSNGAIPTHWTALPLLPHSHTCLYTTYDSCSNFLLLLEVQNMSPGVLMLLFIAEFLCINYDVLSLQCKTCSLAQNLLCGVYMDVTVLCSTSCPVWMGEWLDCAWNAALQAGMLIGYLNQYEGACVCVCASACVHASMCVWYSLQGQPYAPPPNYYMVTKVHDGTGCTPWLRLLSSHGQQNGPLYRNGTKKNNVTITIWMWI